MSSAVPYKGRNSSKMCSSRNSSFATGAGGSTSTTPAAAGFNRHRSESTRLLSNNGSSVGFGGGIQTPPAEGKPADTDAYLSKLLGPNQVNADKRNSSTLSFKQHDHRPAYDTRTNSDLNDLMTRQNSEDEMPESGGSRCARRTLFVASWLWIGLGIGLGLWYLRNEDARDLGKLWLPGFFFGVVIFCFMILAGVTGLLGGGTTCSCSDMIRRLHGVFTFLSCLSCVLVIVGTMMVKNGNENHLLGDGYNTWLNDDPKSLCKFELRMGCRGWSKLCQYSAAGANNHSNITISPSPSKKPQTLEDVGQQEQVKVTDDETFPPFGPVTPSTPKPPAPWTWPPPPPKTPEPKGPTPAPWTWPPPPPAPGPTKGPPPAPAPTKSHTPAPWTWPPPAPTKSTTPAPWTWPPAKTPAPEHPATSPVPTPHDGTPAPTHHSGHHSTTPLHTPAVSSATCPICHSVDNEEKLMQQDVTCADAVEHMAADHLQLVIGFSAAVLALSLVSLVLICCSKKVVADEVSSPIGRRDFI